MSILERIDHDFKEAMKAKEEVRLSVLRMLKTSLKNQQINVQHDLSDQEVGAVLRSMIKQYQDALNDFTNAGRSDLAARQQKEIDLLSVYLPPALPLDQLEALVKDAVQSAGVTDVGKAIGVAMKAVNGRADGGEVRKIVERLLARP